MCIDTHAVIAQTFNNLEKFMSLNGMTLFELSRGQPKAIKVCHATVQITSSLTLTWMERVLTGC